MRVIHRLFFKITILLIVFCGGMHSLSADEMCADMPLSKFPSLEAKNLNDAVVLLPDIFRAEINIVLLTLAREHAKAAEEWSAFIATQLETVDDIDYAMFSVAVIGDVGTFVSWIITNASKSTIPKQFYDAFIPIFSDRAAFLSAYGIIDEERPLILNVDSRGNTVLLACGALTEDAKQYFLDNIDL